jgi:hypothetical protein
LTQKRSRAQIFLENIQRDVYKDRNLWLNEFNTRRDQQAERYGKDPFYIYSERELSELSTAERKFYKNKIKSELSREYVEVPTEYEDPVTYNIIMGLSRDIKSVAPKGIDDVDVQFGTLPLGPVDAMHIAVPGSNEHLIIIESELFYFCNMISKVVATACPIIERETTRGTKKRWVGYSLDLKDVENNLRSNDRVLKHFIETFLAYLIYGSITKAPAYIVPEEYFRPHLSFRFGMELFAMGHEYGHILSGNPETDQLIQRNIAGHEVTEIAHTQAMEIIADAAGAKMMMDAMLKIYGIDISVSYANTELFLQSLLLLRKSAEITKKEHPLNDGSHPSLKFRRDALRGIMKKICEESGIDPQPSLEYASKIGDIVWFLWDSIEPHLYAWYKLKTELMPPGAPIWEWIERY